MIFWKKQLQLCSSWNQSFQLQLCSAYIWARFSYKVQIFVCWVISLGMLSKSVVAVSVVLIMLYCNLFIEVVAIGVNWGSQASHPLPPATVVRLLQANGIRKVKLFEADTKILGALSRSGIQVMVGIPNDLLAPIAASVAVAERWVSQNVSAHVSSNGVDIRFVVLMP